MNIELFDLIIYWLLGTSLAVNVLFIHHIFIKGGH